MKISGKILIAFLAVTLAGGALMAQTTRGDIQGRVVDEQGGALPGVTISINSDALIGVQNTIADAQGLYKFLVLPPGAYSVTFSLSGYQTRTQENIAVKISSTTRVDSIMTSAFTDEVVVTSESPLVDTSNTQIGVDLSSDFYMDLPVGRNYTSVAAVTPGAQADDSGQTFYGSTGAENAYYIDGANTTGVEYGTQGTQLNFEFIDEVQVKSGSYSAEYGRATGSVISVITKSGGNEFHGDVFGYWDDSSLQSDLKGAAADGALTGTFNTVDYNRSDYGFDLGGYIVKDKLWFFVAYDRVDNTNNKEVLQDFGDLIDGAPYAGDQFATDTKRDLYAAKLTWRVAANHSISGSYFADPGTTSGVLPGASLAATPLHFAGDKVTGGDNYSLNYDGIFGQNVVISARVAQHNEEDKELGAGHETEGYIDFTQPITIWGWSAGGGSNDRESGFGFHQNQEFSRDQYNVDLSWFVGNLAGSHEFKIGYEYEDIGIVNENWNGGNGQRIYRFGEADDYYYRHRFFLSDPDLDPTQLVRDDILAPLAIDAKSDAQAFYLQDTWQLTSNLSLALGVRFSQQRLYNSDGGVQADIDDNIAPRLGLVWDVAGNGKSKIFAHWGKFYESIPADIVIRSFGGEISIFTYNLSDDPNDVANDPDVRNSRILGGGFSRVDPGTKGQHLEELVIGGEYEFAPSWAVGIKYIKRDLKKVIEDALALDGDYFIGNPGFGEMQETYSMGAAWGYNDAGASPIPTPTREFQGVEFTLQKRFSNNFQFITSLLFSELTGNYDGLFQASTGQLDPNLNSAFDYADFQVNNDGNLSNDIPVQFKFDGIYRFNFGLTTGLSAHYRDGTPVTAMGYAWPYNNWEYYLSKRGEFGTTDSVWEADLHFGYPVKLGSALELNLLVDIFNVFNNQGETGRDIRYTTANDTYEVLDWDTNIPYDPIASGDTGGRPPTNPAWNTANRWQDPRTVRLGVRLTF